jgi:hypothetical protein
MVSFCCCFETPSGFAIFTYYGVQLFLPNAKEVLALFFLYFHVVHSLLAYSSLYRPIFSVSCFLQNIWSKFVKNHKTHLVSTLSTLLFVGSLSCFSPI